MCCNEGQEIDWENLRTPEQQEVMKAAGEFILPRMGQTATPLPQGAQLSQPPDPSMLAAMNTMMGLGGYGGYQAPEFQAYPWSQTGGGYSEGMGEDSGKVGAIRGANPSPFPFSGVKGSREESPQFPIGDRREQVGTLPFSTDRGISPDYMAQTQPMPTPFDPSQLRVQQDPALMQLLQMRSKPQRNYRLGGYV